MDETLTKLEKFEKRASNDLVELHQILQEVNNCLTVIREALNLKAPMPLLVEYFDSCESHHLDLMHSLKDVSYQIACINEKLSRFENDIKSLQSRMADFEESFLPFMSDTKKEIGSHSSYKKLLEVAIPKEFASFRDEIYKFLESAPKPKELDLDAIKAEIKDICRQAIDESKAALNKTITNQSRLHILEKKVAKLRGE